MDAPPDAKRRKLGSGASSSVSSTSAETPALKAYRELLQAEVKSTRSKWADFVRLHRRDRRFSGYGRTERERERAFKDWLVELGERKRAAQLQAEDDFLRLLEEQVGADSRASASHRVEEGPAEGRKARAQDEWAEVKRTPGLDSDARYDAVGSSTRRGELFAEWVAGRTASRAEAGPKHDTDEIPEADKAQAEKEQKRKRDKALEAERALRAREEQVRREREQAESRQRRVLNQATHAEDVIAFKQMLIDYVRDPLMTFPRLSDTLGRTDKRFSAPSLRPREKEDLLAEHRQGLIARRRRTLHSLFKKVAPSLATEREVALPLVREEDEWERAELGRLLWGEREQVEDAKRGGFGLRESEWHGLRSLEREWEEWNAARHEEAERDFKEMLSENAFVEFWGRLKQHRQEHDPDAPPAEDLDSDDEEAAGMLEMAKNIDLDEVDAVLRPDARFQAWAHRPELRTGWMREHMERLAAPKQTVHRTGLTAR